MRTSQNLRPTMFRRFLAYYRPERGLFIADTVCALVIAGIDLAFPVILRSLTGGLFLEGADAIMAALGMIALGLVAMYLVRMGCRYFVSAQGHIMGARMESRMRQAPLRPIRALLLHILRPCELGRHDESRGERPLRHLRGGAPRARVDHHLRRGDCGGVHHPRNHIARAYGRHGGGDGGLRCHHGAPEPAHARGVRRQPSQDL